MGFRGKEAGRVEEMMEALNAIEDEIVIGTHGRGAWEVDISASLATSTPEVATRPIDLMLDPREPDVARERAFAIAARKWTGTEPRAAREIPGQRRLQPARVN